MDLGAYAQINNLQHIMKENGIEIPRLRGLRLMKNEEILTQETINKMAKDIGLEYCESACRGYFEWGDCGCLYSDGTNKMVKKYFIRSKDGYELLDVNWKNIHGKKRKRFKYELKQAKKRVEKNYRIFNKYCGQDGVLYIHARLGGFNWTSSYYDCPNTIGNQPWFLEKVDDPFDSTYCDIYARIKEYQT